MPADSAGALARLALLHREAATALRLVHFCNRVVPTAVVLLLGAAAFAILGGGSTAASIAWGLLVAAGLAALFVNSRKGQAQPFADGLAAAVADLRAILLYLGFAWGAGAFLALRPEGSGSHGAALLAAFAILPSFAVAGLLRDAGGAIAFAAPATTLVLAAALLRGDPARAGAVLLFQALAALLFFKNRGRQSLVPAGLA